MSRLLRRSVGASRPSPPRTPPFSPQPRWWASSWRTVRVTCARSSRGRGRSPASACPEDHDPVVEVVPGDRVALVEPVGAAARGRRRRRRSRRARARDGTPAAVRRSPSGRAHGSPRRTTARTLVVVGSSGAGGVRRRRRPTIRRRRAARRAARSARTPPRTRGRASRRSAAASSTHRATDDHGAGARTRPGPRAPATGTESLNPTTSDDRPEHDHQRGGGRQQIRGAVSVLVPRID